MQNFENIYETQFSQETQYEIIPEILQEEATGYEINPEYTNPEYGSMEFNPEIISSFESPGYEISQMEEILVNELSAVATEEEFGQFLKGLVQKAAGATSNFLNSQTGQNITNQLTNIAKKTLPNLAGNLGSKVGGYLGGQAGRAIGGRIGGAVGAGLGKDIMGYAGQKLGGYGGTQLGTAVGDRMSSFVKFAKEAIQRAAGSRGGNPVINSQSALVESAKRHYPFILRKKGAYPGYGASQREGLFEEEVLQEEYGQEIPGEITLEGTFNEQLEIQLASELLSINSEEELDMFLGKLIKKAAGAVKSFARSGAGKALGGLLKNVAKKALPFAAKAAGTFFGGPIGGMIGGKLGSYALGLFEIQLEGLSPEDKEFEVARRFVRFAGNAARRASRYRPGLNPYHTARNSFVEAAKRYAPGALNYGDNASPDFGQSGNWFRQGNSIIIQGV